MKPKPTTARSPKHTQIFEAIRSQIDGGELKPGDRLPSYSEMRERYGAHTNTMEKVLARLELEQLIERHKGLGVFVNKRPRQPAENRVLTIGLSGVGFGIAGSSAYWGALHDGIREVAAEAQVELLLLDHLSNANWEKADGLILCDYGSDRIPTHMPHGMPCVSVLKAVKGMSGVAVDEVSCGRQVTEYLLSLGHRRIAYLHAQRSRETISRRIGYKAALQAAGIEPARAWSRKLSGQYQYGADFMISGHESMKKWFAEDWTSLGCTALIAHNDDTAIGAMKAFAKAGIRVPNDVSVVGFDGAGIGAYITPTLTTLQIPLREMGINAMQMLLQRIGNNDQSQESRVLPARIIENESTARLQ